MGRLHREWPLQGEKRRRGIRSAARQSHAAIDWSETAQGRGGSLRRLQHERVGQDEGEGLADGRRSVIVASRAGERDGGGTARRIARQPQSVRRRESADRK